MYLPLFAAFTLISSGLFSQADTVRNNVNANVIIEEFDDNHVLRSSCYYADDTFNKLLMESVYLPDGKEISHVIWYWDGLEQNIFTLNSVTGKTDFTEIDSSGNIIERSECSDTLSDSKCSLFFSNGKVRASGFKRIAHIIQVDHFDSTNIGSPLPVQKHRIDEVKTGNWHYYYKNGNDSAAGDYSPIGYYAEESIWKVDTLEDGTVILSILVGKSVVEIKTGPWNYFSPEGKLIRKEEWDKGNLLKRETF